MSEKYSDEEMEAAQELLCLCPGSPKIQTMTYLDGRSGEVITEDLPPAQDPYTSRRSTPSASTRATPEDHSPRRINSPARASSECPPTSYSAVRHMRSRSSTGPPPPSISSPSWVNTPPAPTHSRSSSVSFIEPLPPLRPPSWATLPSAPTTQQHSRSSTQSRRRLKSPTWVTQPPTATRQRSRSSTVSSTSSRPPLPSPAQTAQPPAIAPECSRSSTASSTDSRPPLPSPIWATQPSSPTNKKGTSRKRRGTQTANAPWEPKYWKAPPTPPTPKWKPKYWQVNADVDMPPPNSVPSSSASTQSSPPPRTPLGSQPENAVITTKITSTKNGRKTSVERTSYRNNRHPKYKGWIPAGHTPHPELKYYEYKGQVIGPLLTKEAGQ